MLAKVGNLTAIFVGFQVAEFQFPSKLVDFSAQFHHGALRFLMCPRAMAEEIVHGVFQLNGSAVSQIETAVLQFLQ